MTNEFDRRTFLKKASTTALGVTALTLSRRGDAESVVSFRSEWPKDADRPWPGPDYWPNPLQDWRVRDGRLECFAPGGDRNVALLTRSVANRPGDLAVSVHFGKLDQTPSDRGFVGFRVVSAWVATIR